MGISIRLSGINHFVCIAKPHAGNANRWATVAQQEEGYMKTEAIRFCIQSQHGKQDYDEARKELNALLDRLAELEAAQHKLHTDAAKPRRQNVVCPECEALFAVEVPNNAAQVS